MVDANQNKTRLSTASGEGRFFLARQILLFIGVFILVLFLDLILYVAIGIAENEAETTRNNSRLSVSTLSDSLIQDENRSWKLDSQEVADRLAQDGKWAVLIDAKGSVVWEYNKPADVPSSFNRNETVLMAHNSAYKSYPVFLWTKDANLTVLGYQPHTYSSFSLTLPQDTFERIPLYILLILLIDAIIFFLFYLISRRQTVKYIAPALEALDELAQGRATKVRLAGPLRVIDNKINRVSDTLLRKEKARKHWVEGVSHDVRTPLAVIMGHAEQIEHETTSDSIAHSAHIIVRQGSRIRDLVEDLNIATQLEYDMQPLRQDSINLARTLRELVAENINRDNNNLYAFEVSIAPDTNQAVLLGDEKLLCRAFQNSINNSIKHNPEGCTIAVRLEECEGFYFITFADNGRGMNEDSLRDLVDYLRKEMAERIEVTDTLSAYSSPEERPVPPGFTEGNIRADQMAQSQAYANVSQHIFMHVAASPLVREEVTNQELVQEIIQAKSVEISWWNQAPTHEYTAENQPQAQAEKYSVAPAPPAPISDNRYFGGKEAYWENPSDIPVISGQKKSHQSPRPPLVAENPTTIPQKSDGETTPSLQADKTPSGQRASVRKHGIGTSLITRIVLTHSGSVVFGSKAEEGFWIKLIFS